MPLLISIIRGSFVVRGAGAARSAIGGAGKHFGGGVAEGAGNVVGEIVVRDIFREGKDDKSTTKTKEKPPFVPAPEPTPQTKTDKIDATTTAVKTKRFRLVTLRDDLWRNYTTSDHCYIDEDASLTRCHPCSFEENRAQNVSCVSTGLSPLEINCTSESECRPGQRMISAAARAKAETNRIATNRYLDDVRCDSRRDFTGREILPWARLADSYGDQVVLYSYPRVSSENMPKLNIPAGRYVKISVNLSNTSPPQSMPNARKFSCVSIVEEKSGIVKYGFIQNAYLRDEEPNFAERLINRDKF